MAKDASKERAALKVVVTPPVDAETRVHDDHHVSLRLWLRILSCTNQIENRIRQEETRADAYLAKMGMDLGTGSVSGGTVVCIFDRLADERSAFGLLRR